MMVSSNQSLNRIDFIDGVKFFVMFLCIIGHLIQNGSVHLTDTDWKEDGMFLFIYSFHMPLFLFVSGLFLEKSLNIDFLRFFIKKVRQLLLPAYSWNFVIVGVCYSCLYLYNIDVNYPTSLASPYWFITLLFLSYCIGYAIMNLSSRIKQWGGQISYILTGCAVLAVAFLPKEGASHINSFFIFFMAGHYLRNIIIQRNQKLDTLILILSFISYFFLLHFWRFEYTVYYSPLEYDFLFKPHLLLIALYRDVIGMSAILFIIFLFKKCNVLFQYDYIKKLGRMTLGIYLLQSPIILIIYNLCPINIDNHLIRDFMVIPFISILIYVGLAIIEIWFSRNKYLALIFYGKKSR